ncbi:hypothetical protein KEM55_002137 [Ascosphaera atra]|nr:hypothetical protein KEM55_002137 [Ascosphaera atra]
MAVQTADDAPTAFGQPMRKHFLMAPNYRNLNHGSYGTIPRQIQAQQRAYQDESESCPDRFMRLTGPAYTDESRSALSKLLHVPRCELVFVRNATTGVNVVLRNLVYEPGDVILYFATTYGACAKTVQSLTETTAVVGREVVYELPATHGELGPSPVESPCYRPVWPLPSAIPKSCP